MMLNRTTTVGRRGRGRRQGMSLRETPKDLLEEQRILNIVNQRIRDVTSGRRFIPPLIPPQFTCQPWNNIVVRFRNTLANSVASITVEDLAKNLTTQAGLCQSDSTKKPINPIPVDVRIQKVMCWIDDKATTSGMLTLYPYDFDAKTELAVLESTAQKNMYACVGYAWPISHQTRVLDNTTRKDTVLLIIDATNKVDYEMHFHILWRGSNSFQIDKVYAPVPVRVQPSSSIEVIDNIEVEEDSSASTEIERRIETVVLNALQKHGLRDPPG